MLPIIIVTWNSENDIAECIESFLRQTTAVKIFVVDNASSDKTVEIVKKYPEVELLAQTANHYFTGGNNIGIKYVIDKYDCEFVMIANPDTIAPPNLAATLLGEISADKNIGAVGPKVIFAQGADKGKINSAGLIYDGFMQAYDRGFASDDNGQFDSTERVFGVTGTCVIFRTEMLKQTGLFWEKLQMYLDEVELFIRAQNHNWEALYCGKTHILHKYMQSTNQNKQLKHQQQLIRNWLLIAWRHYSLIKKLVVGWKYIKFKFTILWR